MSLNYIIPLFFFNDPATTEIYTLSLHDALPINDESDPAMSKTVPAFAPAIHRAIVESWDRQSSQGQKDARFAVLTDRIDRERRCLLAIHSGRSLGHARQADALDRRVLGQQLA